MVLACLRSVIIAVSFPPASLRVNLQQKRKSVEASSEEWDWTRPAINKMMGVITYRMETLLNQVLNMQCGPGRGSGSLSASV